MIIFDSHHQQLNDKVLCQLVSEALNQVDKSSAQCQ